MYKETLRKSIIINVNVYTKEDLIYELNKAIENLIDEPDKYNEIINVELKFFSWSD